MIEPGEEGNPEAPEEAVAAAEPDGATEEPAPEAAAPSAEVAPSEGSGPLFDGEAPQGGPADAESEDDTPEELKVHLPSFDGPLDLLLHLVRKHKVDIYDIPIALITEQYNATLEAMRELNLEVAGEFIYMASLLIHIKSKLLLPQQEGPDGEPEDPRRELVDRLVEYRKVKEIAEGLHELETLERGVWTRKPSPIGRPEAELPLAEASIFDLVDAFGKVLERFRLAHPPALKVAPQRYSVKEKMLQVLGRTSDGPVHLVSLLSEIATKGEVVVLFVATLELVRLGLVRALQQETFGEILLHRTEGNFDFAQFEDSYQ